jgi:hypothetical protein
MISRNYLGGLLARPVASLFLLFGRKTKYDAAVKWYAGNLDVETFAVGVCERNSDAGPEAFLLVAVTYLICDIARGIAGFLRFGFIV